MDINYDLRRQKTFQNPKSIYQALNVRVTTATKHFRLFAPDLRRRETPRDFLQVFLASPPLFFIILVARILLWKRQ